MFGWHVAYNFEGCRFTLEKQEETDLRYALEHLEDVIDKVASYGRVLAVILFDNDLPYNVGDEERKNAFFESSTKTTVSMYRIMPFLITARNYCGYSAVFACQANPDDPDLVLLERDGVDVMKRSEAIAMVESAERDEHRVYETMELTYLDEYYRALGRIRRAVEMGLSGVGCCTRKIIVPKLKTEIIELKDTEALLLGLVEKPEIQKTWPATLVGQDAGRLAAVAVKYPEYREKERAALASLAAAWEGVSPKLGELFWKDHDRGACMTVFADDVISTMCLENARDAYGAGVPIEDIVC